MNSRILFISTSTTSDDRGAWSGTVYKTFHSLVAAGYDVDYLSAMRDYKQSFTDKLICTYWLRIPAKFGKSTRMDESFYTVRVFRQTLEEFDYSAYDIIFIPTHIAIVNALPKGIKAKIVHLVDATVDSLFNYYTEFSNLWFHNYWEAHILGRRAFRRSDLIIASSDWCKNNAINQYGIAPGKISVVEFGANIDDKDIPLIKHEYKAGEPLRIYWSGVNWVRKGGDVAFECCRELISRGYRIKFHITGMRELPEDIARHPWVYNHGFLNKNIKEEYRMLIDIMSQQDIFLFPSRAECSSIALCEASAFGLPCFVYDTGGTANYVQNGYNGYMLPLPASGKEFANRIVESIEKKELPTLSQNARLKYETTLNWKTWREKVYDSLNQVINVKS